MRVDLWNIPQHHFPVIKKHNVFFLYSGMCRLNRRRVDFLLGNNPSHQCSVDNNEESEAARTLAVLLPVTPNTEVSGTSQRHGRTHLQTHSKKQADHVSAHWHCPEGGRSRTHTPAATCTRSHRPAVVCTPRHVKQSVDGGIKHENKHSRRTRGQ